MDPLDQLLSQIDGQHPSANSPLPEHSPIEDLLAQPASSAATPQEPARSPTPPRTLDTLLCDIAGKGGTRNAERETNPRSLPTNFSVPTSDFSVPTSACPPAPEIQQLRQAQAQTQRQALEARAKEWLKTLDPMAGEGQWFETFAEHYPSRLEAAIDYLATEPA